MADCQIIQKVCKRAGERRSFLPFELVNLFSRVWVGNQPYSTGVRVRPNRRRRTGFEYESSGGQSKAVEPRNWPEVEGETVTDGPIVWTARQLSNSSLLYRINTVTYDVPDGITNHELDFIDEPGAQQVPMEVSGGTVGETYNVIALVTTTSVGASSQLIELVLAVTIE